MARPRYAGAGVGRSLLVFFGIAFVLHLFWEMAQGPLYQGIESTWNHFRICLYATATGDMIFMAVIYAAVASAHGDWNWIMRADAARRSATWVLPLIIGPLLAVSFELWAIYREQRWVYGPEMPLVPVLGVGLAPLAQMILIPPASIAMTRFALRKSVRPTDSPA